MSRTVSVLLVALIVAGIAAALLALPAAAPGAMLIGGVLAVAVGLILRRIREDGRFLVYVFIGGLLARLVVGTAIYMLALQEFFGGDAVLYDKAGYALLRVWQGETYLREFVDSAATGWGMLYLVAGVYAVVGRNMLAIQYVNAVVGAMTAPVIYLCARQMFHHARVARAAAVLVAFFPSLVLWSSQGLKDGPIIFLLALSMLATLQLGEKLSAKNLALLTVSLLGVLSLRFYVFYMLAAAIGGAFLFGMQSLSRQSFFRQLAAVACIGVALTYFGVLRTAGSQFERYGNLEAVNRSRGDLARSGNSGFGKDVDVSTAAGALTAIPLGATYLLFAPFPWQMQNLRQSITMPEMLVWWGSFPLLVLGLYFTVRYRLRQALPILMFTTMLTLAYSVFQGNIGTAYRQRAQILIFYFIFVGVGYVLLRERREDSKRRQELSRQATTARMRAFQERRRAQHRERREREKEWAGIAEGLAEKIDS